MFDVAVVSWVNFDVSVSWNEKDTKSVSKEVLQKLALLITTAAMFNIPIVSSVTIPMESMKLTQGVLLVISAIIYVSAIQICL